MTMFDAYDVVTRVSPGDIPDNGLFLCVKFDTVIFPDMAISDVVFTDCIFKSCVIGIHMADTQFIDCVFQDCLFDEGVLRDILFVDCDLDKCSFKSMFVMHEVDFQKSNLTNCVFEDLDDDTDRLILEDSSLTDVEFIDYRVCHWKVTKCMLRRVKFMNLTFKESTVEDTVFIEGVFCTVEMPTSIFRTVDFTDTKFTNSTIGAEVKFKDVQVTDIEISGCDINLNAVASIVVTPYRTGNGTVSKTTHTTTTTSVQSPPAKKEEPVKHKYQAFLFMSKGVSNANL